MAGLAASAPPLAAGPPPLRLRNPAPVCGLTRPPLLKVAKPQSFVRPRFVQASRRKFTAASSSGRQGLRTSQYQFDDDEPLWLAVVRECAAGLRSFVAFLADQPRQLKHLEWPGFQNTVAKPQSFVRPRFAQASRRKFTAASSSGRQGLRTSQYQFDDDEPLWLAVVRECAAGLRSFVAFLADQPRQLKHLEWPGFQNTLRTATLTLILVAVFIVALSSVDAALSYILSWLLRKSA